jgi:hypothetical protein
VSRYKSHPIYGIGVRGAGKEWHCRGLIFNAEDKVTEIKRLECPELTFKTRGKAEAHALKLCEKWIDEQSGEIGSNSPAKSVSLKDRTLKIEWGRPRWRRPVQ